MKPGAKVTLLVLYLSSVDVLLTQQLSRVDRFIHLRLIRSEMNLDVPDNSQRNVREAKMTHLVDVLRLLGVHSEVTLAGRWATIQGERCQVHVVEAPWGAGYYGWCDDPGERAVKRYHDPVAAIQDGLRRAAVERGPGGPAERERNTR
jgi:hypothetical protein